MYQAVAYHKNSNMVHIWDDQKGHLKIKYKPYAYRKSSYGKHVALDGQRVDKVFDFDRDDKGLYESDINPETRTLIDMYTDSDESSVGHRILTIDIEVDIADGFPTPETAEHEITSMAVYDHAGDERYVWVLDKQGVVESTVKDNVKIISCHDEYTLLEKFLHTYYEIQPTIITGWNIDFFDIPYLYNRLVKVVGEKKARTLSPIKDVIWLKHRNRYRISGVSCLDYMALYKNFTYNQESSYSLEAISQKELGKGKIKYEGSLDDLLKRDIQAYIDYNMNDVDLVVELDQKMKLIDLARGICHKGHVPYEDFLFATRYLDGAAVTYLNRLNIVAPNRQPRNSDEPLDLLGAYVKAPNPGRYKWVYDLDLTSLYPSIIMTLGISPETKVTKIENFDGHKFVKGQSTHLTDGWNGWETTDELQKYLNDNEYSIAANGVIYDTKIKGFLPSILDKWFNERVEYKNLRKKYEKEGDEANAEYYDRMQLVTKILLNSFYGVLGNPGFRFFDPDNATAITSTGQQLIKFTADIGNQYYTKELQEKKDYCIYTDTDSTFFSSLPIIESRYPNYDITDEGWMAEKTIEVADEVQAFINKSYDIYAKRFHNVTAHRFDIKQENVAKAGLWIAKKRYAQWIINVEGHTVSKLDVKGLDVVRSSFPPSFRKFMAEVLEDMLNDIDKVTLDEKILNFKDRMKTLPLVDVMFPIGVKNVTKYVRKGDKPFMPRMKGTPVHVKSALNYNDMLRHLGIDKRYQGMINGEKIKWTYLKTNAMGLDTMALKGFEDPEPIDKFVTEYIDYEKVFNSAFANKLGDFYSAMNWGSIPKNNNLGKFFSF
jgi:DNA polymerase elongation subunit (family B)